VLPEGSKTVPFLENCGCPFSFREWLRDFQNLLRENLPSQFMLLGCCLISHYCYKLIHVLGFSGQDAGVVFIANFSVVYCHSKFVWLVQSDTACSVSLS